MIDTKVNPKLTPKVAATRLVSAPSDERQSTSCSPDTDTVRSGAASTSPCASNSARDLTDIEMKYHIDPNVLGVGHHGSVRQCIERSTGKRYAVKSICKTAPSVNVRGIQREISLLEGMNHERILQLVDVFEDSEYVHIVTELCSGGELFDKIVEKSSTGQGCFSEDQAARILHQILSAVSYMHKHSIVHRDIKPENILFETAEEDSPIKIIDFGLARKHRAERGEPPMSTIVGTPYYISPDVLRKSYNKSSDLWSVGVIAYILLCGYPPFNGSSNSEVYSAVQRGLYYFPSEDWKHVSSSARDFVVRLLQTDPRRRMTAEQAMSHPWIVHHLQSLQEMDVVNDDTVGSSFVEVVLDGSASLQNESIVCGGESCISTPMHC
ncbi:hypothetical protein HJC23_010888 [Cyclotella cryptica]|uniref:Protein kinase domain-containing protein n=1 Tax=Cyclotella cryptica TaxID=29204 RepID=A0ABD3NWA9_9STRA|eukprot:CCRYP_019767-RA/>CCRYP_019767-RA protein AED:0.37 eAED:0.37 QI:0/-1/0/1/-1/1/1/0/380